MNKDWHIPLPNSNNFVKHIAQSRGLSLDESELSIDNLPEEKLFANIAEVASRIQKAMYNNEPLVIFGHDDPDGVTSSFILYQFFNSCGYQKHQYYIPNRNIEPHGIQAKFIQFVREGGFKLVITVDNGISSYDGVQELNQLGCDVLIVDHHLVQPETLPPAYAIMNPQLPDCKYPFKGLAGVGVVLMLIRYLSAELEHPIPQVYYFWTAVGSTADKVPMIGVNRMLVNHVLKDWSSIHGYTMDFLIRNFTRVNSKIDVFNFIQYAARFIANGREEGGKHTALSFMLEVSDAKADLFEALEKQKNDWESELNRVFKYLDALSADFVGNAFIFFDDEDAIPYSLLGTGATYIVNKLGIPTILLKQHNGRMVCEGRCSDGFNMVHSFTACKSHLIQYGGHPKAAGFSMAIEKYDDFIDCFNEYVQSQMPIETGIGSLNIEALVSLEDLNDTNWKIYESLLPFGQQNPEPILMLSSVKMDQILAVFSTDNQSLNVPQHKTVDISFIWKNKNLIRVVDYRESIAT